jgi:hypothetical protein
MPRRLPGGYMPNPIETDLVEQEELLVSLPLHPYLTTISGGHTSFSHIGLYVSITYQRSSVD